MGVVVERITIDRQSLCELFCINGKSLKKIKHKMELTSNVKNITDMIKKQFYIKTIPKMV